MQPNHALHNLNTVNLVMFSQHCSDGQHMLLDALGWRLKMSFCIWEVLVACVCSPSEYSRSLYHIHVMCMYSNTPFSDPYPLPCSQPLTHCHVPNPLHTAMFPIPYTLPCSQSLPTAMFPIPYTLPCSQSLTHCHGQVKAKYDTIARLWAALPTDAQVQRRQALLQADLVS